EPDGTGLLLEPSDNPIGRAYMEGVYAGSMPALVLGTTDVQADYERLTAKGVVFREPPTRTDWGVQAVFEDTCGNLIQITQM
ncbi:MAG: VOC family protein, partial [Anaerolineae bacterium]|nr:VOC family protein [Anaerolineae bacterium]